MSEECRQLLLIGVSHNDPWRQVIEEASAFLGNLQSSQEVDVFRLIHQQDYVLIVIDAAKVEDVFLLISSIRAQRPEARVVVVTTSPTWRRAREAFRAGATDYIRKSLNKRETLAALQAAVDKGPPP